MVSGWYHVKCSSSMVEEGLIDMSGNGRRGVHHDSGFLKAVHKNIAAKQLVNLDPRIMCLCLQLETCALQQSL